MPNALYICYFGIREPLVQTQVLPYLRELVKMEGLRMSLVTFEPKAQVAELNSTRVAELNNELAQQGIDWHWLRYHKWPSVPATAWDVLRGIVFVWRFIGRNDVDLLHARVHLPMLIAAIARKLSRRKPKILFDIRGFFPEEYVDAGIWPEGGWLYRAAKRIERWLMKEADGFIVLTEKAREILFPESSETGRDKLGRPVEVIPCCVDLQQRFGLNAVELRNEYRTRLGLNGRVVITHLGALGGLYLTEEMVELIASARAKDPATFAMFLTQSDPIRVVPLLEAKGFTKKDYFVKHVDPIDVPGYLYASDVALSIVQATFATQSRSPTKIPEYLACGLPIIANRGIGDVNSLIEQERVGGLIDEFNDEAYRRAFDEIDRLRTEENGGERRKRVAQEHFDLEAVGGQKYRRIYQRIFGPKD